MARLPRVYIEGILYYVTSNGGHNQMIFVGPEDYAEYISLIDKYKKQYGFKLFSYGLMPTHLHMLIELKNNIGISNIMHDINSLYTKAFNSRYNKKGHLFQERFATVLAEKESFLLPLARHIHLNPKRLGLVRDIGEYPYSSYKKYITPSDAGIIDMKSEIEEVFGILNGTEAVFMKYISGAGAKELNEIRRRLHKKRILGTKDFEDDIKKKIASGARRKEMTPAQRKARRSYLILIGAVLLVSSAVVGYFYKEHAALKTEYDKTLAVYDKTLEMLKTERDNALRANKSAEEYAWKIRVAEKALEEFKIEREALRKIDGYAWKIVMRQTGGPDIAFRASDMVEFNGSRVIFRNLSLEGFPESNYSKKALANGKVVWETIQTNKYGDTASWRGVWDGKVMRGVLSRRSASGAVSDFSFISTGKRIKR